MRETISHASPFFSLSKVGEREVGKLFCCSICCVGRKGGSFSAFRKLLRTCVPEIDSIPHHIGTGSGIRLVDCLIERWWRSEEGGIL